MPQAYPPESLVGVPVAPTRLFPILQSYADMQRIVRDAVKYAVPAIVLTVPWDLMLGHAEQAMKNHYQTLGRLAEHGGLSASEAVAVLEDRAWHNMPDGEDYRLLFDKLLAWHVANGVPKPAYDKLAFEQGSTAYVNQQGRESNPWTQPFQRQSWWAGWDGAMHARTGA